MTADVHTLTGAYAVDALSDEERRFFEQHLAACAPCRQEVAELRETAAMLGTAAAESPPPELKGRLLSEIDRTRQLAPLAQPAPPPPFRERFAPVLAAAAAVFAVAVLGLGTLTAHLNTRVQNLEGELAQLTTRQELLPVLTAPDVEVAQLSFVEADGTARFLYSPSLDRGVLVAEGLESVGPDQTYEIWTFHDGTPVPAGLFDADEQGRAMAAVDGTVAGAELVAVTVEARGGVPEPAGPLVLQSQEL